REIHIRQLAHFHRQNSRHTSQSNQQIDHQYQNRPANTQAGQIARLYQRLLGLTHSAASACGSVADASLLALAEVLSARIFIPSRTICTPSVTTGVPSGKSPSTSTPAS